MIQNIKEVFDTMMSRVATESFFANEGLGNELAFYIYDYDPRYELEVRAEIKPFIEKISNQMMKRVLHIDMLDLIVEVLKNKGLLEKAYEIQKVSGNDGLLEALKGTVNEMFLTKVISERCVGKYDLLVISGIGKSYPISRAHNLLNNLHAKMCQIPLIMMYPGVYNKQSLNLFDEFKDDNYYRAFRLVDRQEI